MRHRKSGRHFSRPTAHRHAMLDNLATQLLQYEAIQTTEAKAKELRSVVDKLITLAKRGDIHVGQFPLRQGYYRFRQPRV